jgi:DNA replication protein DnaC
MAEDAVSARIDLFLTELRMPSIRSSFRKLGKQIAHQGGDYIAFLHAVLEEEVNDRRARRVDRRIQDARFPQLKELGDLQEDALPKGISLAQIFDLAKGDYLRERANVIAIGGSGTGKTHVSIGLAVEACRQCKRARFYTASDLVSEIEEAHELHQLHRFLKRFATWDVVVIDELGYLPLTERGAELLFQAFSARHEQGSVIINSNLAFSEWTQVFRTERLAVAMLDRVTHRAHVLEMNGESYRLRSARSRNKGRRDGA